MWLYKAALDRTDIAKLGVYLHEPSRRVVVPVFDQGSLVYWQARSVDGRQPKYINPQVNRQRLVAKFGRGDPLVLTEDVLSAYRVGWHTEAWSLMGTKLTDYIATAILKRGGRVLVWLDPDWQYPAGKRPGVIAAKKITNQLRSMGVQVERIVSRADPKLLSRRRFNVICPSLRTGVQRSPQTVLCRPRRDTEQRSCGSGSPPRAGAGHGRRAAELRTTQGRWTPTQEGGRLSLDVTLLRLLRKREQYDRLHRAVPENG